MLSDELKAIVERLREQGKMSFLEAATEEQIAAFEEKNNIKFPLKYREWLLFSDGGEFFLPAGIQLYGISHEPIIDMNDSEKLDNMYIVIGALASGDPILCEKNGEKIMIFNSENERIEPDEIYEDFFALLNDMYDLLGIGE